MWEIGMRMRDVGNRNRKEGRRRWEVVLYKESTILFESSL
jgi:hypothetical protein